MLADGAPGFIAQFEVFGYGSHQAVVVLFALHTKEMLSPLNITVDGFIRAYRESYEVTVLPVPTMPYRFKRVTSARVLSITWREQAILVR